MKKIILLCLTALMLSSCSDENSPESPRETEMSFGRPTKVGVLPDGRTVSVVIRERGNNHDHYIYFVDNTISVNTNVQQGKTTRNQATVLIDGIKYVPATPEKPAP